MVEQIRHIQHKILPFESWQFLVLVAPERNAPRCFMGGVKAVTIIALSFRGFKPFILHLAKSFPHSITALHILYLIYTKTVF
jgi:hypothetical protein